MPTTDLKPAPSCYFKLRGCRNALVGILILGALLMCAPSAFAQDENQYENVNVNGIVLNGFEVFALEQATGQDIPNGNYWYEMATGRWGYMGGPEEGYFNLPESFKKHITARKENAAKSAAEFAQVTSYTSCPEEECWY